MAHENGAWEQHKKDGLEEAPFVCAATLCVPG